MLIKHKTLIVNKDNPVVTLVPIGDLHITNDGSNIELFHKHLKKCLKLPNARIIGLGDYSDYIYSKDERYDPSGIHLTKDEEIELIVEELSEYKDSIDILLKGNHEEKMLKKHDDDVLNTICSLLGNKSLYAGYMAYLIYTLKDKKGRILGNIKVFCHHGWATGNYGGINSIAKYASNIRDWDIFLVGHSHQLVDQPVVYKTESGGEMLSTTSWICCCGSFMSTLQPGVTTYADKKGYPLLPMGAPVITIKVKEDGQLRIDVQKKIYS